MGTINSVKPRVHVCRVSNQIRETLRDPIIDDTRGPPALRAASL
jgi:hypothetical protein